MLGVSAVVFILGHLTGNPVDVMLPPEAATPETIARLKALWGLDRPLPEQFLIFLGNAVQGNFGYSFKWQGESAMGLVLSRLPATLELSCFALLVSLAIALPIGVLSATRKDTGFDKAGKLVALLGQSVPSFWLGIIFIWVFAVTLRLLPTSGRGTFNQLLLPGLALGWFMAAALM